MFTINHVFWKIKNEKTFRVSLTYRVKSAHKVKLTDKQLLQWMVPILLVMVIYLSSWTISDPPYAIVIADSSGLKFYQCSFNWWDHSLAVGKFPTICTRYFRLLRRRKIYHFAFHAKNKTILASLKITFTFFFFIIIYTQEFTFN